MVLFVKIEENSDEKQRANNDGYTFEKSHYTSAWSFCCLKIVCEESNIIPSERMMI